MIGYVIFFFVAGMALILLEFILPGAICGIVGTILLLISLGIGVSAYPDYALAIIVGEGAGALVALLLGILVLARTPLGRRFVMDTEQRAEAGYISAPTDSGLAGKSGVALTALRPAGVIEVEGERLDAVADGAYIAAGARVRILEVHGSRIVVEAESGAGRE